MLAVDEARKLLARHPLTLFPSTEKIPLEGAYGRTLANPLRADRQMPPFARVMMDGFAVRFLDVCQGPVTLRLAGLQRAGDPPLHLENPGTCIEIMTGAVMPTGLADTIVPYEHTDASASRGKEKNAPGSLRRRDPPCESQGHVLGPSSDESCRCVSVEKVPTRAGEFVHAAGSDAAKGDVLMEENTTLLGPQIALAATTGQDHVEVLRRPRVALVSTGDELVPVSAQPEPHQIRMSNVPMIAALLRARSYDVTVLHLRDDPNLLRAGLEGILATCDVLLVSGGVSAGAFDLVPSVLADLGVEKVFHKVKQRPGKPLWFGRGGESGPFVFGLPGNPVSTLMCFICYVLPWMEGRPLVSPVRARLAEGVEFKAPMDFFVPCAFSVNAGTGILEAHPLPGNNSGDGVNLRRCQGFLRLEEGAGPHLQGSLHEAFLFTGALA